MSALFASDADRTLSAIDQSTAIIEFDLDGKILRANRNFCELMDYAESEIVGRPHSLFVDPAYAASPTTRRSGPSFAAANSSATSSGASPRAGARSSSAATTTRSATAPARW